MLKNIIFDYDGTISASGPGIIYSVINTLKAFSCPIDEDNINKYVGPPLDVIFREFGGLRGSDVDRAVDYYRADYLSEGYKFQKIYQGIPELLKALVDAGYKNFVATSKYDRTTASLLKDFDLFKYFSFISGANEERSNKTEVLSYLLKSQGLKKEESVMIGDRYLDMEGARANGVKSIGALYGYGSEEEFKSAIFIAKKPSDIFDFLKEYNNGNR